MVGTWIIFHEFAGLGMGDRDVRARVLGLP